MKSGFPDTSGAQQLESTYYSADGDSGRRESDEIGEGLLSAKRHALVMLEHLMTEHGGIEMLSRPNSGEHAKRILSGLKEQADTWLSDTKLRYKLQTMNRGHEEVSN